MKKIITFIFSILSIAAIAQQGSLSQSVYRSRVNDTTTVNGATSQGYGYFFWNNQRATPIWQFWNGTDLVDFDPANAGGSFSLSNGNGTTANGTAVDLGALTGNVSMAGNNHDFELGTSGSKLNSAAIKTSGSFNAQASSGGVNTGVTASTSEARLEFDDGVHLGRIVMDATGNSLTGNFTAATQSANDNSTKLATTAYADAKVADAINNGTTTIAPSQNAVYDALALKGNLSDPLSQFASTTSAQLAGVISDEVGTGSLVFANPSTNTQTASYQLALSDAGKMVEMNNAGSTTVTIPPSGTTDFPDNALIAVHNLGAGTTTLTAGSGVTFLNQAGGVLTIPQYSIAYVKNRTGNDWYVWNSSTVLGSALTSTRLPVANGSGLLIDDPELTYNTTSDLLTVSRLQLAASSTSAGTAPIKITSGTLMTSAEAGAIEYDGSVFYMSPSTTRYRVMIGLTGSVTQDVGSISAQTTSSPNTITVTGAAVGDPVYVGASAITAGTIFTAQVTATNTVTVYITNPTSGALDPPNATYSVRVIKTP